MARNGNAVVGLDIGTTKVCAIVAESNGDGTLDVIGVGNSPSRGLRKGVVINIEATVDSIRRAVEDAELMAGVEIRSAFVGIAGGHIKGINSRGVIAISGKNREVTQQDVERVIDAAKAVALPVDREVLHVLPQEFAVDDQGLSLFGPNDLTLLLALPADRIELVAAKILELAGATRTAMEKLAKNFAKTASGNSSSGSPPVSGPAAN